MLRAAVAQPLLQQEVVYEGRVDAVPEDEVPEGMFRSLDATEDLVQRLQNQCALLETLTRDAQGMRDKTAFFTSVSGCKEEGQGVDDCLANGSDCCGRHSLLAPPHAGLHAHTGMNHR